MKTTTALNVMRPVKDATVLTQRNAIGARKASTIITENALLVQKMNTLKGKMESAKPVSLDAVDVITRTIAKRVWILI